MDINFITSSEAEVYVQRKVEEKKPVYLQFFNENEKDQFAVNIGFKNEMQRTIIPIKRIDELKIKCCAYMIPSLLRNKIISTLKEAGLIVERRDCNNFSTIIKITNNLIFFITTANNGHEFVEGAYFTDIAEFNNKETIKTMMQVDEIYHNVWNGICHKI